MVRLTPREFIRLIGLPTLIFVILFFGGSELLEHHFYYSLNESTLHLLHTARGILSVFFITVLVYYLLTKAEKNYLHRMDTICSLLNAANQGLIAFDASWSVRSMNSMAAEMLGNTHSTDFRAWSEQLRDKIKAANDVECASPNGEIDLRVIAIQSQGGGHLLLLQDISDEHKSEDQWIITEKMATIGRMAAGLAHEIGTPLNIISGRAELIESMQTAVCAKCDGRSTCAVGKHISVIFQQIERITRIIQQLLSQAREPARQKEMFSLNDTVQKVVTFVQPELDKKNIHLNLHLQNNLPEIYGSTDQYQQVLINLLTNAMDAVNGNGGKITISTISEKDHINLIVEDNGSGIPDANLTKIFDPFFTTKEFGKGTGLGLTVTSNIVRSHGGTIDVKSKMDQGTQIIIHLPTDPPSLQQLAV